MKYSQEEFEAICGPLSTDLKLDLSLGPKDSYNLRSLSRLCANRVTTNLDWGVLGARLALTIIRSTAGKTFSESTELLKIYLKKEYYDYVQTNAEILNQIPDENKSNNKQAISIGVLEKTYLLKYNKCKNCKKDCPECEKFHIGETPEQMYMRIATFLYMPNIPMIKKAYNLLSDNKYSHATPTMFNAGCERHQMASCFVLTVSDSLWSIEDHWMYVGEISRNSGGIGLDASNIRHSYIANSGKSDGVPAVLMPFEAVLNYVDQSKKRKGSAAIFLSIWHIDIEEFINLKVPVGQGEGSSTKCLDLFYSVWVNDLFMKRCEEDQEWSLFCPKRCPGLTEVYGEEFEKLYIEYENSGKSLKKISARKLLQLVYLAQCKVGVPYICLSDRFNESSMQKNIGLIRSSNLCVSGDTMILTNTGYFPIKQLVGKFIQVWNGIEFTPTVPFKTGSGQKMMRASFSNGTKLVCTPYHKFYLNDGQIVDCASLKHGMKLISCKFPIITTKDASFTDSSVPLNCELDLKLKWFKMMCEHYGILSKSKYMHIHDKNDKERDFLFTTLLMLQTMGCNPSLVQNEGLKTWRLVISPRDLYILGIIDTEPENDDNTSPSVVSVEHLDERMDTYCFKEEKLGLGIFNGVITGQCAEIALHTSEKEIASCNLASLCLSKFVKNGEFDYSELSEVTRFVVRIMNNVIDRNYYLERIPQIKYANLKNRPLGIGIQGLANVFATMELMFDSDEAYAINNKIIQTIYYAAVDESANIAQEIQPDGTTLGPYPAFPGSPYSQGKLHPDIWKAPNGDVANFLPEFDWNALRQKVSKGVYNSTLVSCMPTASSSVIAEQEPCFEPFNFIVGSKTLISGQYTQVCREFAEDMEKLGVWSEELCSKITENELGSCAELQIPESIKNYPLKVARWKFLIDKYRTSFEIGPKATIMQGIARTPFVCQSQSLNWFVAEPTWKKFYKNCIESWKRGAKTCVYYNRGKSNAKARAVATCTTCST